MPQEDTITAAIEGAIAEATPEPVETDTPTEGDTPVAEGEQPAAEASEADKHAAEGDKPEGEKTEAPVEQPKKKRGPIPYDRHEAVLTKARREADAKQAELQKRIDELVVYENNDHKAQRQFLKVLEQDPKRAVELLRQLDPQRFAGMSWVEQKAEAKEMVAEAAATTPAEKPKPDVLLPDGTLGYSAEGAEKLASFLLAQAEKKFDGRLKELEGKVKPVLSEHEAEKVRTDAYGRAEKRLQNARDTWEGFKDHEPTILQRLQAAEQDDLANGVTLAEALWREYQAVVIPALKADRAKIEAETRTKVMAELNAKGKAGRMPQPGRVPAPNAQPASTDPDERMMQVIRDAVAGVQ